MLSVVPDDDGAREDPAAGLDEIVLEGARRMLAQALEAAVAAVIEALSHQVDGRGHVSAPRGDARRVNETTGEKGRLPLGDPAAVVAETRT